MFILTCILLLINLNFVISYNFDTNNVQIIDVPNLKNAYFGYAVMLQNSIIPSVIVGAPKQDPRLQTGGSIFRCDLQQSNCTKFTIPTGEMPSTPLGNWLGSVVDGESDGNRNIFTCAPKTIRKTRRDYFLNGVCYKIDFYGRVSTIYPLENFDQSNSRFHYAALAQAGLDIKYLKETGDLIMGAPGIREWIGALVIQPENKLALVTPTNGKNEDFTGYLGYKVTADYFSVNSGVVWYVAGAPRNSYLRGKVRIFIYRRNFQEIGSFMGEETGSYFGAALLAEDVNGDGYKDLFVGAPMGAGKTWDEGYVYYYRHKGEGQFDSPVILLGSKSTGARFGTVISKLGDIDLDSFNDIAVSAPNEDNGVGAVYIYKGTTTGISTGFAQKLTPGSLNVPTPGNINGFGLGLSNGADVDYNGYNDIAIGAYKSDQVFVIRSKSIVDYKLQLRSNISVLQTDTKNFVVEYCLLYAPRRKSRTMHNISFITEVILDARGRNWFGMDTKLRGGSNINLCSNATIQLINVFKDISPFKIILKAQTNESDVLGNGEPTSLLIPFSHGCGSDNICQTNLSLQVIQAQDLSQVVFGVETEFDLDVRVENTGEPAYLCELTIEIPQGIELRNLRSCYRKNTTYICPVSERLNNNKTLSFKFDIEKLNADNPSIDINFQVRSLGRNIGNATNSRVLFKIPVHFQSTPYMESSSTPENFEYKRGQTKEVGFIVHKFTVGNSGPSPVKLDLAIKLPRENFENSDTVDVMEVSSSLNGIDSICNQNPITSTSDNQIQPTLPAPENRTIRIDCLQENSNCVQVFCTSGYLYKSETAEFLIKFKVNVNLLANKYMHQLKIKDILALTSTASLLQKSQILTVHSTTLVYVQNIKSVPLWAYVVAAVLGASLLALLIFGLCKCHFFDRSYRDKLNQELMELEKEDPNDGQAPPLSDDADVVVDES